MLERIREMLRSAQTSRHMTRAIKAFREGDLATARTGVDAVVAATTEATSRSIRVHQRSLRLIAVALRAEVAAKQGDDAVARASIAEGLLLWEEAQKDEVRGPGVRSVLAFADWERWAKGWLASHPGN